MLTAPAPRPWYRDRGVISGVVVAAALTAFNLSTPDSSAYKVLGVMAVVPLTGAVLIEKAERVLWLTAFAVLLFLATVQIQDLDWMLPQWVRLGLIVIFGLFGYWAARKRLDEENNLFTMSEVARTAQRAIMRPEAPDVPGVDVVVRYLSATEQALIGGDAYEAVSTPFGLRVLVADARGKGLDAVRAAATALGSFREWAQEEPAVSDVLIRMDASVGRDIAPSDFVTALVAQLNENRLTFALAGHPAPVRVRDGEAQTLQTPPSPPLGMFERSQPVAGQVDLMGGDLILLYSDGLTEARNAKGEFFALDEVLVRLLSENPGAALSVRIEDLITELREFVKAQLNDDLVIVALQLKR